ncbi:hypothetical protein ISN44_As09g007840 [Arabidopsis suecica]|uniref:Uncharacterized protein n=1 Tax=Arabidopsis suecica TaxID=45249 RepID=A0A8T2AFB4_ARASU|nr:hypothetical protein ISN44_As09g007840 [Arabidopsis suecica]
MAVFAVGMIQRLFQNDPVLLKDFASNNESCGELIVVGSYVPKTIKHVNLSTNNTNFFVIHPGVPYIVFPEVVKSWSVVARRSTKELLLNAEKGGYAVGAFNVYNLEGV